MRMERKELGRVHRSMRNHYRMKWTVRGGDLLRTNLGHPMRIYQSCGVGQLRDGVEVNDW